MFRTILWAKKQRLLFSFSYKLTAGLRGNAVDLKGRTTDHTFDLYAHVKNPLRSFARLLIEYSD